MQCYCGQAATLRIPSIPEQVCRAHAIEFWTGLLAYTSQRSMDGHLDALVPDPSLPDTARVLALAGV